MRFSPTKFVVVLALFIGIYGVLSWIYIWPSFHYAQAELRRLYHGNSYETDYYKKKIEAFSKIEKEIKNGDIIFLGDSITEGFELKNHINHSELVNLGISGDTSYGVLNRLNVLSENKNSIVFLMIGVNDLGINEPINNIRSNIEDIISYLKSKGVFVVIQSVLITDGRKRDNYKIFLLNQELKKLSKQSGITYLDLNPFMMKNGKLNPEFTYDGLHLNASGYQAWAHVINVFLNAMIKG